MKYLFIDTNNFIACALLIKPKHSPKTIKKLSELLDSNKIKLILPEVVKIEFFRVVNTELDKIKNDVNNLKEIIKKEFPTYLENEKNNLNKLIEEIFTKRKSSSKSAKEEIDSLFSKKNVINIPINAEIFINAYKRALAGLKPYNMKFWCLKCDEPKNIINADSLIFESILSETKKSGKIELIFCSENHTDFAIFDKKEKKHILHPELKSELPKNTKYYLHLTEVLDFEFKAKIKKAEKDKFKRNLEYIREDLSYDKSLVEYLEEQRKGIASMISPPDYMKEAIASMKLPSDYVKEMTASMKLPSDYVKEMIASMKLPSETLKKQLVSAASFSKTLKKQVGLASKNDISKFKKEGNNKKKSSK